MLSNYDDVGSLSIEVVFCDALVDRLREITLSEAGDIIYGYDSSMFRMRIHSSERVSLQVKNGLVRIARVIW